MIKGKVSSPAATVRYINSLKSEALKKTRMAVFEGTLAIHKEAIELVSKNEGGTPGVRRGKNVTISDPFEPPHTDTGRLRQSIKFNVSPTGEFGTVGSNYKVAAQLEFGTEKMAPRPWLSLAVENTKDKIKDIFIGFFDKGLGK